MFLARYGPSVGSWKIQAAAHLGPQAPSPMTGNKTNSLPISSSQLAGMFLRKGFNGGFSEILNLFQSIRFFSSETNI